MKRAHHLLFFVGLVALLFCDFWFWLVLEFEAFPWAFVPPLIVLGCYIWAWVLCALPKFGKKNIDVSLFVVCADDIGGHGYQLI